MAANSDGSNAPGTDDPNYVTTIITCEGDYYDPTFANNFNVVLRKLEMMLKKTVKNAPCRTDVTPVDTSVVTRDTTTSLKRSQQLKPPDDDDDDVDKRIKVKKLEPWNSVRVTLTIPHEAADRLRQLANEGSEQLRQLGILSVQVEGDQVISLRLASFNGETQEIVLNTERTETAAPVVTEPSESEFRSPNVVCPNTKFNPRKDIAIAGPSGLSATSRASFVPKRPTITLQPPPPVAPARTKVKATKVDGPRASTSSSSSASSNTPYPFTSMQHAAVAMHQRHMVTATPAVTHKQNQNIAISSPLLVNLLQNDASKDKDKTKGNARKANKNNAPKMPRAAQSSRVKTPKIVTSLAKHNASPPITRATSLTTMTTSTVPSTVNKSIKSNQQLNALLKSNNVVASEQARHAHMRHMQMLHQKLVANDTKLASTSRDLLHQLPPPPPYPLNRAYDQTIKTERVDVGADDSLLTNITPSLTDLSKTDLDSLLPSLTDLDNVDLLEITKDITSDLPDDLLNNLDVLDAKDLDVKMELDRIVKHEQQQHVDVKCETGVGGGGGNNNKQPELDSKGRTRKYLLNPLSGDLEPLPSDASDNESDTPAIDVFSDVPDLLNAHDDSDDSCGSLRARKISKSASMDIGNRVADSDNNSSDTMSSCKSENAFNKRKASKKFTANKLTKKDATGATEKIKLRLKLEKTDPAFASYYLSKDQTVAKRLMNGSPSGNVSATSANSATLTTSTTPTSNQTQDNSDKPRVPPLHISFRGQYVIKNAVKTAAAYNNKFIASQTSERKDATIAGKLKPAAMSRVIAENDSSNSSSSSDNSSASAYSSDDFSDLKALKHKYKTQNLVIGDDGEIISGGGGGGLDEYKLYKKIKSNNNELSKAFAKNKLTTTTTTTKKNVIGAGGKRVTTPGQTALTQTIGQAMGHGLEGLAKGLVEDNVARGLALVNGDKRAKIDLNSDPSKLELIGSTNTGTIATSTLTYTTKVTSAMTTTAKSHVDAIKRNATTKQNRKDKTYSKLIAERRLCGENNDGGKLKKLNVVKYKAEVDRKMHELHNTDVAAATTTTTTTTTKKATDGGVDKEDTIQNRIEANLRQLLNENDDDSAILKPNHAQQMNQTQEDIEDLAQILSDDIDQNRLLNALARDKTEHVVVVAASNLSQMQDAPVQAQDKPNRSPLLSNSTSAQGEDSGIESMDALSEKSPNTQSSNQSPHCHTESNYKIQTVAPVATKTELNLTELGDIEAELAKMEGHLTTAIASINADGKAEAKNLDETTEHETDKDDFELLPVRRTPPLYTYSNPEKMRNDGNDNSNSPAPSLLDMDDSYSDANTDDDESMANNNNRDNQTGAGAGKGLKRRARRKAAEEEDEAVMRATDGVQVDGGKKNLLEQLLIEIPNAGEFGGEKSSGAMSSSSISSEKSFSSTTTTNTNASKPRTRSTAKLSSPASDTTPTHNLRTQKSPNVVLRSSTVVLDNIAVTRATSPKTSQKKMVVSPGGKRKRRESESSTQSADDKVGGVKKVKKVDGSGAIVATSPAPTGLVKIAEKSNKTIGKKKMTVVTTTTTTTVTSNAKPDEISSDSDEPLIEVIGKTKKPTDRVAGKKAEKKMDVTTMTTTPSSQTATIRRSVRNNSKAALKTRAVKTDASAVTTIDAAGVAVAIDPSTATTPSSLTRRKTRSALNDTVPLEKRTRQQAK